MIYVFFRKKNYVRVKCGVGVLREEEEEEDGERAECTCLDVIYYIRVWYNLLQTNSKEHDQLDVNSHIQNGSSPLLSRTCCEMLCMRMDAINHIRSNPQQTHSKEHDHLDVKEYIQNGGNPRRIYMRSERNFLTFVSF
jgi:hypothetical protein